MLMGDAPKQRISWLSGVLVVLALSLAGAVLVVDVLQNQRLDERPGGRRQEDAEKRA